MNAKISAIVMIFLAFCCSLAFAQPQLSIQGLAPVKLLKAQPVPAPLGEARLQATIMQLRQAGGPTTAPTGGERITLTPNKPMAGNSYFDLSQGGNSALTNQAGIDPTGTFILPFATVPGKTSLVDVALGGLNHPAAGMANRIDLLRRFLCAR